MSDDIKTLHTALRSVLQGPKTAEGWDALLKRLRPYYQSADDTGWREPVTPDTLAQLEEEVLPAVEQELDRAWPDALRVASIYEHPRVKRLSKTLHLSFYGSTMSQFAASHKLKFKDTITKKMIRELMPLWLDGGAYSGLVIESLDREPVALLDALLSANFVGLRHLRFDELSPPLTRDPHTFHPEELREMVELAISRRGATLEAFGATLSGSSPRQAHVDALYRPLMERSGELPALHQLGFGQVNEGEDVFAALMSHVPFDKLDTLTFASDLSPARAALLAARPASLNLRRIGVGYLHLYAFSGKADVRALIAAPNMANVEVWDLREGARLDDGWETREAAAWREVKLEQTPQVKDARANALDQEVVDLVTRDAAATQQALLDGGALRASARLKALRIRHIDDALLMQLIAEAPAAWPSLECLVFQRRVASRELLAAWAASPLLDTLKFLDWDDFDHPDMRPLRSHADKVANQAARMAQLALILSGAEPPFLAFRRWRHARSTLARNPDRLAVARALGISKKESPADSYELLELCEQRLIAHLGGKRRLLTWGPTYACHNWTEGFEWPDPVYNRGEEPI